MNEYQIYLRLKTIIAGLHNFTDVQYGKGDLKKLSNDLLQSILKKHDACGIELITNKTCIPSCIGMSLLDSIYFQDGRVLTDLYGTKCDFGEPISCLAVYKAIH